MSVESFVLVPYQKHMLEKQRQNHNSEILSDSKDQEAITEKPKPVEISDDEDKKAQSSEGEMTNSIKKKSVVKTENKKLSRKMKGMVKRGKCKENKVLKIIQIFNDNGGDKLLLKNLEALAKNACSQSAKYIEGEATFYDFLLKKNLFLDYVSNISKINTYFPLWHKI